MNDARSAAIATAAGEVLCRHRRMSVQHPCSRCMGEARRLVAAYEAKMLEAGRKMTPRETTEPMEKTGYEHDGCHPDTIWECMWDAAPQP